ncbi:MAG: NAD-dependent epimerase/dehydratase family protein, partial [Alphaproteobacteria bacterium]
MTAPSLAQEEEAAKPGLTLVAGATGNTGRRLIAALKAQGIPVRAMTRSLENAHEKVGTEYDWVVADVTDISTLPAALDGVENVISTLGS